MNKIGFVVALAAEMRAFLEKLGQSKTVDTSGGFKVYRYNMDEKELYLVDAGVGEISAAAATQMLLDRYGVDCIINFGVCGSLDSSLKIAELTFAESVYHFDRDTVALDGGEIGYYPEFKERFLTADKELLDKAKSIAPKVPLVRVASSEKFIADTNTKNMLKACGANVCEMEAAGALIVCKRHNVPILIIKAISDNADENAQTDFVDMLHTAMHSCSLFLVELLKVL